MFRDRFWLSVLLTIPVLVWSEVVQEWLGFTAPSFPLSDRIPAILGSVVLLYGGLPFLRGGVREVRDRQPGMMLLISLAIVVAFVASLASEVDDLDLEFWWELALLIDVLLLGHWQEMKALGQASGALDALVALLPDEAELVHGSMTHTIPASELAPGDLVLVRPGGRVPADGTIEQGAAAFDESMITGESRTVAREVGDSSSPARSRPTARCASGWKPSATTPRSRGSSGWSRRRKPLAAMTMGEHVGLVRMLSDNRLGRGDRRRLDRLNGLRRDFVHGRLPREEGPAKTLEFLSLAEEFCRSRFIDGLRTAP
jgi:hypothetical protein